MHDFALVVGTGSVGKELEGGYLIVADGIRGRDAHLCQLVGEGQLDRGLVVARSRAVQQVGKAVVLVAEVEGAVRGGIPGIDGVVVAVAPEQEVLGIDGAVGLHGVDSGLCIAFYLYGELVVHVEHAARAVRILADARLRCAPRLRLASLHAEGDGGYLKGVLSFGEAGVVRRFVLRAGSRDKKQCGCGKKHLYGMSFLHIGLFFICFRFVLPPPAKATVAP